ELHRTVYRLVFDDHNMKCHASGDVHCLAGALTVTLGDMHVTHIDTSALALDLCEQDCELPHGIVGHTAVRLVFGRLLRGDAIGMRCAPEERAEIACIV